MQIPFTVYDTINKWECSVVSARFSVDSEKLVDITVCRKGQNPGNTGSTIQCLPGADAETEACRPGGYFQSRDPSYQWYTRPMNEFRITIN